MFYQGDDPTRHESGGSHGRPGAGDLGHLDDAAAGADLDPPPGPGRGHLVGSGALAGIDHDLDAVPLHGTLPARPARPEPNARFRTSPLRAVPPRPPDGPSTGATGRSESPGSVSYRLVGCVWPLGY